MTAAARTTSYASNTFDPVDGLPISGASTSNWRHAKMELSSSPSQGRAWTLRIYGRIYDTISRLMAEPRDKLMQSTALDSLPPQLRRALAKLGGDIAAARRKRSLTAMMMAERIGSAKSTYLKVEKGDPSVSMGVYAMALFVLGFGDAVGDIVDPRRDDVACCSTPSGCQSASVPRKCRPGCDTKHLRRTGRKRPRSRHPPFRCAGRTESAAFAYDAEWLGARDGFAIDPGLPLVTGPQFYRRERGGSIFHGAIADTEPDGWARRVILRDHAKRRQEAKRTF